MTIFHKWLMRRLCNSSYSQPSQPEENKEVVIKCQSLDCINVINEGPQKAVPHFLVSGGSLVSLGEVLFVGNLKESWVVVASSIIPPAFDPPPQKYEHKHANRKGCELILEEQRLKIEELENTLKAADESVGKPKSESENERKEKNVVEFGLKTKDYPLSTGMDLENQPGDKDDDQQNQVNNGKEDESVDSSTSSNF